MRRSAAQWHSTARLAIAVAATTTLLAACTTSVKTPSSSPHAADAAPDTTAPTGTAAASLSYTERLPDSLVEFDMVWIPEGNFWIGKTEVTWDEYLAFCAFDAEAAPPGRDAVTRPSKPLEVAPADRDWGLGRRPAVSMSWNGAKEYCRWLSRTTGHIYRLPTEAEWRLACGKAHNRRRLNEAAWTADNSGGRTQEVGQKQPNEHGLHDMLGNLWEYCLNPYEEEHPRRPVLRGGSWKEVAKSVTPNARLPFDDDWVLDDPTFPPGVWWVPDGDHLGMRVLREVGSR